MNDHDLVGAYCTDSLDAAERDRFEAHLAHCPSCAEQTREYREALFALASAAAVTPPEMAPSQPTSQNPRAARRPPRWRWIGAVAAAAAVFVSGAVVGRLSVGTPRENEILALASAPDARLLPVDMMGTQGTVVKSQKMDEAAFLASDLPIPAKGMCYQIWKVAPDGTKTSAGVVLPDENGNVAVVLDTSGAAQSFVITLEPPGGSKQPTGEMVGQVGAT